MAKLIIAILMLIAISIVDSAPIAKDPKSVSDWFGKLSLKKEKITKLHFYYQNVYGGKNQTAVKVARANRTDSSPSPFGEFTVMDERLTTGSDPNSMIMGRAQGIYVLATISEDLSLLMTMNLVFTSGKYNGSTLSLLGANPFLHEYREMPIVGGSGVFRLAHGIATARTIYSNITMSLITIEYHVIVIHYQS